MTRLPKKSNPLRCSPSTCHRHAFVVTPRILDFLSRLVGSTILAISLFGGTACAQQADDTQNSTSNVWGSTDPAPGAGAPAASTYQMTPQQREELKRTMQQTAQQVGQVTKDFKAFYAELQKAVKDSGIVEEVNKMNLDGASAASVSSGFGATDIRVSAADMTVTVDLPGVDKKNLSVSLAEASSLRIRVDRDAADDPSEYRLAERYRGNFDKTVPLPYKAVGKNFNAQLRDGVLTVVIPREKASIAGEVPIPVQ